MLDGFIKAAAATPEIRVADCEYNADNIIALIAEARARGVKVLVFPELCVTGYCCHDLFYQPALLNGALAALEKIVKASEGSDMLAAVGCPLVNLGELYNCAVIIQNGEILGVIPKKFLPNYNEFYEARQFTAAPDSEYEMTQLLGRQVPFGTDLLFECEELPELVFAAEICEDLWAPEPPSIGLALGGATVIANLSASNETIGKEAYRRSLVTGQSARLICGYIFASAGEGESTQDLVFGGHRMIAENGTALADSGLYTSGLTISEIDVQRLATERRRNTSFGRGGSRELRRIAFSMTPERTALTRNVEAMPFVPQSASEKDKRCSDILQMQAHGLAARVRHTGCKSLVIGISGGLDSCLALLVSVEAMKLLNRPTSDIITVTMPCFGTTKRTKSNAETLCQILGTTLRVIDISDSVRQHFKDISHDENDHNVTYENAQARERTQVLMDIANEENGLVIGTGDLSELALGWATYNGDHMSMYGVNASVPKTLVRHIVHYYAQSADNAALRGVLLDIFNTPVSPELLPAKDGEISQITEDLVGPYELHDFFLYNGIRWGFPPKKAYRLALYAFGESYDAGTILKWLKTFYRRFFAQQFKRSCLPDGVKVGSVSLSPRGDWRMPSDASAALWLKQIDEL
ncbi:MAG: NAD(+) synthase [Lachnospiraceae bacterium]|nr:NAD(+) synthase [Ruminococcus sp.]MCM1275958.1 NAD(+) synthase [Lachnospiraceae bacterium]